MTSVPFTTCRNRFTPIEFGGRRWSRTTRGFPADLQSAPLPLTVYSPMIWWAEDLNLYCDGLQTRLTPSRYRPGTFHFFRFGCAHAKPLSITLLPTPPCGMFRLTEPLIPTDSILQVVRNSGTLPEALADTSFDHGWKSPIPQMFPTGPLCSWPGMDP